MHFSYPFFCKFLILFFPFSISSISLCIFSVRFILYSLSPCLSPFLSCFCLSVFLSLHHSLFLFFHDQKLCTLTHMRAYACKHACKRTLVTLGHLSIFFLIFVIHLIFFVKFVSPLPPSLSPSLLSRSLFLPLCLSHSVFSLSLFLFSITHSLTNLLSLTLWFPLYLSQSISLSLALL